MYYSLGAYKENKDVLVPETPHNLLFAIKERSHKFQHLQPCFMLCIQLRGPLTPVNILHNVLLCELSLSENMVMSLPYPLNSHSCSEKAIR